MPLLMPQVVAPEAAAIQNGAPGQETAQDLRAQPPKLAHYELTVHTAPLGATSAEVAVQLCGYNGDAVGPMRLGGEGGSGELLGSATRGRALRPETALVSARDGRWPFRQAGKAVFDFDAPDVGPLTHLRVGHDGSGDSPAWHLDRVELRVTPVSAGDR